MRLAAQLLVTLAVGFVLYCLWTAVVVRVLTGIAEIAKPLW